MNKKVRNATEVIVDNIEFKSKLESQCYLLLKQAGFNPNYEKDVFIIQDGFYPSIPVYDVFYSRSQKDRVFGLANNKVRPITYTPDFTFDVGDILIVIEVKGKENDVFPVKKKLFIKWMDSYYKAFQKKIVYFIVYNKKQMLESIKIIKEYEEQFIATD